MMCVELRAKKLYIVYVQYVKIKLILTHTEHTSTTSPLNETQNCDKGTVQVWSFRDVCRIEGQKSTCMYCVQFTEHVKSSLLYYTHT